MAGSFYDLFPDEDRAAQMAAEIAADASAASGFDARGSAAIGAPRPSGSPVGGAGSPRLDILAALQRTFGMGLGPEHSMSGALEEHRRRIMLEHPELARGAGFEPPQGSGAPTAPAAPPDPLAGKGSTPDPAAAAGVAAPPSNPLINVSSTSSGQRVGRLPGAYKAQQAKDKDIAAAEGRIADSDERAGTDKFLELAALRDALAKNHEQNEAKRAAIRQVIDGTIEQVKNANIDPERYWQNKGGLDRTMLLVASLGGGLAEGASGGRIRNKIPDMIQAEVDRDIAVQRANLAKTQSLLGYYYQQIGDLNTAERMTRETMLDGTAKQLEAQAAMLHGKQAQDRAAIAAAVREKGTIAREDEAQQKNVTRWQSTRSGVKDAKTGAWATPEQIAGARPQAAKPYSMSKAEEDQLMNAAQAVGELDRYLADLKQHTDGSAGALRNVGGELGLPGKAKALKAKYDTMALTVAKAAQGGGQVSNQDAKRTAGNVPSIWDDEKNRQFKVRQLLAPVAAGLRKMLEKHKDPSAQQRVKATLAEVLAKMSQSKE